MHAIPDFCLVALCATSAANLHPSFTAAELLPTSNVDLATLLTLLEARLQARQLAAVDISTLERPALQQLVRLARRQQTTALALLAEPAPHQRSQLEHIGFTVLEVPSTAPLRRRPLAVDQRTRSGPFDIIGDVHGCFAELVELLKCMGYTLSGATLMPPPGRTLVFVGDLVDRGPDTPAVLRLVQQLTRHNAALSVAGNHDDKLLRALSGHRVHVSAGLDRSLEQLLTLSDAEVQTLKAFLAARPSHVVLDNGALVVAHAGLPQRFHNRDSARVRAFAMYGDPTGEVDASGLPIRRDWAASYAGSALVVYGHTPVPAPRWLNNTLNLDTGCVFGGALSALRYPENTLVSVPAQRTYARRTARLDPPA